MKQKELYDKLQPYKKKLFDHYNIIEKNCKEEFIEIKDFFSYSININKNENKPILIFIHGFGGFSILYTSLFKYLIDSFNLYSLDWAGFGLSSIPSKENINNIFNSTQNCLNYYLEYIKEWIDKMNLKNYYLMGHSFGGYLVSHFANKYNIDTKKLFLISPAGFNKAYENKEKNLEFVLKDKNWLSKKIIIYFADWIFEKKKNWYKSYNKFLRFFTLKIKYKKLGLDKFLVDIYYNLVNNVIDCKGKGYEIVSYIFHYGVRSQLPISEIYWELKKKYDIYFYFGDIDWMDKEDVIEYFKNKNLEIDCKLIKNASHDIHYVNPLDLYEDIINDFNSYAI